MALCPDCLGLPGEHESGKDCRTDERQRARTQRPAPLARRRHAESPSDYDSRAERDQDRQP